MSRLQRINARAAVVPPACCTMRLRITVGIRLHLTLLMSADSVISIVEVRCRRKCDVKQGSGSQPFVAGDDAVARLSAALTVLTNAMAA